MILLVPLLRSLGRAHPLRRARRIAEGCCPACGYDLSAFNTLPECCPECGDMMPERPPLPLPP